MGLSPDEVMDADEEVVVAATRAGLADLLQLASTAVEAAASSPGSSPSSDG